MRNRSAAILAAVSLIPWLAACEPAGDRPLDDPQPGTLRPADGPARPTGAPSVGAWIMLDGRPTPVRYLCDGVDRPRIVAVLEPNRQGRTSVAVFSKSAFGPPEVTAYDLGPPDPGAGQIYEALLRGGAQAGYVRRFNPGALDAPAAATLPTLSEIKLGDEVTRCRWTPNARFLGFTAQRSVLVTRTAEGGLAYTAFDFKAAPRAALIEAGALRTTTASLNIEGGQETEAGAPQELTFDQADSSYRLRIGGASADLILSLGGAPIDTEPFIGWVYAGKG